LHKLVLVAAVALALVGAEAAGATERQPLTFGHIHIAPAAGVLPPLGSLNNLQYGGGQTMHTTSQSYAIFWEPSKLQDGTPTQVSPTYNSLLTRYFQDVGGSRLYNNNTQYYDTTAHIANSSSFSTSWLDTSPYPASDCTDSSTPGNCISDAAIQAEVKKAMTANGWTGGLNKMFFVFTSANEGSCASAGECAYAVYCAYHSYFSNAAGQTVIYANQPYAGSSSGCMVPSSPNNDIDADSTINVTSHEHMEAVTDPQLDAWTDLTGQEIGDKCAWDFGTPSLDGGAANVQWNGDYYIVQQEWDNAIGGCTLAGP
jgi:hypothetical protein